ASPAQRGQQAGSGHGRSPAIPDRAVRPAMRPPPISRDLWLAPLAFFQLYLLVSVVLFFVGPWPWEPRHPWLLAGYLLTAQAGMAAGYLLAWDRVETEEPLHASVDATQGFMRT